LGRWYKAVGPSPDDCPINSGAGHDRLKVSADDSRIVVADNIRAGHDAFVSEEDTQVLRRQDILVERESPTRDLPGAVDPPQQILAGADKEILLGFAPAAVDEEIAMNR
jgi:hypothetical protein